MFYRPAMRLTDSFPVRLLAPALLAVFCVMTVASGPLQARDLAPGMRGGGPVGGGGPAGPNGPNGPGGGGSDRPDPSAGNGGPAPLFGNHPDDDDDDIHEKALERVRSGEYQPLSSVMRKLRLPEDTMIIDVNLQTLGNNDVYVMTIKDTSGHIRSVRANARTGEAFP